MSLWSFYRKATAGAGLPGRLLGAAEGLSYVTWGLGALVLMLQVRWDCSPFLVGWISGLRAEGWHRAGRARAQAAGLCGEGSSPSNGWTRELMAEGLSCAAWGLVAGSCSCCECVRGLVGFMVP